MSTYADHGSLANADIHLFETGNLADAIILCGGRFWNVHKVILASRCTWFHTAFYGRFAVSLLRVADPSDLAAGS